MRASRVREDFERQVIADAPKQIDAAVADLIDWMVEREHRLGQDVNEYLARRRQTASSALGTPGAGGDEHVVGGIGASFDYNRRSVLQRVSTAATRALSSYDQELESKQLATSLQGAVATTAVAEAGAVGLGIGVAIIVGGAAADVTGIAAGLLLATLGLASCRYASAARRIASTCAPAS